LIGFIWLGLGVLLVALEWAAQYRGQNNWIIWLLPIGGLLIGLGYHYYGKEAVKGNNLLLEEYETHKDDSFKMALSAYRYDNHPFIWWVSRS
jgi:H+/Cl- antiporter ClcA